jgi:hypothetical protein
MREQRNRKTWNPSEVERLRKRVEELEAIVSANDETQRVWMRNLPVGIYRNTPALWGVFSWPIPPWRECSV